MCTIVVFFHEINYTIENNFSYVRTKYPNQRGNYLFFYGTTFSLGEKVNAICSSICPVTCSQGVTFFLNFCGFDFSVFSDRKIFTDSNFGCNAQYYRPFWDYICIFFNSYYFKLWCFPRKRDEREFQF